MRPSSLSSRLILSSLVVSIVLLAATFVIGMVFVRETKDVDIYAKFLYWHPNRMRR